MKRITRQRIAVIEADNAAMFETAINARLDDLAEHKPELIIEHHQPHTAYLLYHFDEYQPEGLADEFHLRGINYKCGECAYCTIETKRDGTADKRRKRAICSHHQRGIDLTMDACDTFYFEMVNKTGQFQSADGLPDPDVKEIAAAHHDHR